MAFFSDAGEAAPEAAVGWGPSAPPAQQNFGAAPADTFASAPAPAGWGGGYAGSGQTGGGYAGGGYSTGGYSGGGYASGGYSGGGGYAGGSGYSSGGGGYAGGGGYSGGGYGGGGYSGGYGPGAQNGSFPYALDVPPSKGTAIASLVLGIISLPLLMFCLTGAITGIAGLITGFVALSRTKKQPQLYAGRGMALAGTITSAVAILFCAILIPAIAIPNLLASRRAANEGAAQSSLRTIASAEFTYQAGVGRGQFGTLDDLAKANLIDGALAGGAKSGYRFRVTVSGNDFAATAVPESYGSSGNKSFYISANGVLRAANKSGLEADANDEPYDASRDRERGSSSATPISFEVPSEGSAIRSLRTLQSAEATYQATYGAGKFGELSDLYKQGLISEDLARGSKDGYRFSLRTNGSRFEAIAIPESFGDSARSFYISEEGVIRTPREAGDTPTAKDPPIDP